nr:synaptopodin isoform X2 [Pelodiscus sinensis]XP_025034830.1 synaptopodin isoform X1 [Pelodiscus sinensis]|eukprot:XP_014436618.1 synaptopodin isoform X2 [Pelodiscus sinensis]
MLKATLLQPCLQPQPSRVGSSDRSHCAYGFGTLKVDPAESYGRLVLQQEEEKEEHQRRQPTGALYPFNPKEREEKTELSGGKWRERLQQESWNINGDVLAPRFNSSGVASTGGYPATRKALRSAPELLPSAASADPSHEWKVVKVKRVLISPAGQPRKANLSRSASFSEKELKEAKARSQKIAAQLTNPPSSNSKGVLLFNRRKQRVNEFTLESAGRRGEGAVARGSPGAPQRSIRNPGKLWHLKETSDGSKELKESLGPEDPGAKIFKSNMEGHEERPHLEETPSLPKSEVKSEETLPQTYPAPSHKASPNGDIQQVPLTIYLRENIKVSSTNGVHEPSANGHECTPVNDSENNVLVCSKEQTALVTDKEKNGEVINKEQNVLMIDKETVPVVCKETTVPVVCKETTVPVVCKETIVPVASKETTVPVSCKETTVPVASKEMTVLISCKETFFPVASKETTVPVASKETTVPVTSKETTVPVSCKEMPVPVVSEETTVPVSCKDMPVPVASKEWNGTPNKQYYEVHLTLAKPKPVKNRTARPFGTQSSVTTSQPPEKSPGAELPPPPTYAETLFSPPPVTRVRSPPAYSALYPSAEQKPLILQEPPHGESKSTPLNKSGILEESVARRAPKKPMFTFVEKPKVAPNPDLLNLVQRADIRRKQKGQGEPVPEEEPFALGAEASNFQHPNALKGGPHLGSADNAPEWSSCLKSPRIQPKPQVKPNQNLAEAKGKGAELFARRQSRMEKYVIESPAHPDWARSPSPTMSLPPSWKYDSNVHVTPVAFKHSPKSPARSAKTPPASLYNSSMAESELSRKELEIAKQQPYQLQSSLFILSPAKEPPRLLPRGPPPPQPAFPNPHSYTRHTSCPTSPLTPTPDLRSPALSTSSRPAAGPLSPSTGTVLIAQDSRTSAPFASPSRVLSPRAKGVFQAPRPSYSTRNAGIEPQERRVSLPASLPWTPRLGPRPSPLDGWLSPALTPEPEEGPVEAWPAAGVRSPPPPMSPSWSERSLSPLRQEPEPKASRQMQARLARNIINAARRKSSSPKALGTDGVRPFTPPAGPGASPASASPGSGPRTLDNHSPSPQSPRALRPDGHRPASAGTPQFNASCISPRALGSHSPTYSSPLQSPRAARPDGHRSFTLPANARVPLFNAAAGSSPGMPGSPSPTCRHPELSPKATWTDGHRSLMSPPGTGVLPANTSSCTSPRSLGSSSPTFMRPVQSPTGGARYPVKRYTSRSPTDSDVSIDSEDSGAKSPGIRSFNICPRGWNGSMRLKPGRLPSEASCTS